MGNVDTHRAAHDAFNRRDYDEAVRAFREDAQFTDHPRGVTVTGPMEFAEYLKGWSAAFSDATVAEPRYLDAGQDTVCLFYGSGINDGPMGPLPATGNKMYMPFCEVLHYDADGRISGGELFYDSATMMVQLGHMEAPSA